MNTRRTKRPRAAGRPKGRPGAKTGLARTLRPADAALARLLPAALRRAASNPAATARTLASGLRRAGLPGAANACERAAVSLRARSDERDTIASVLGSAPPAGGPVDVSEFVEELMTSVLQDLHGNAAALDRVLESYERLDRKYPGQAAIAKRLADLRGRVAKLKASSGGPDVPGGTEGLLVEFVSGLGAPPPPPPRLVVPPPSRETSEERYRKLKESLDPTRAASSDALLAELHRAVSAVIPHDDHEAQYNMGLAYRDMGLLDGAVDWFRAAQRDSRHRLQATFALATCLVERGEADAAARELEFAVAGGGTPDELVEIRYLLATLHERAGRVAEASELYRQVREVNPSFRQVAERLARLS